MEGLITIFAENWKGMLFCICLGGLFFLFQMTIDGFWGDWWRIRKMTKQKKSQQFFTEKVFFRAKDDLFI